MAKHNPEEDRRRGLTDFTMEGPHTNVDPRPLDIKDVKEKAYPKV